jgi:hypothetical protein
MKNLILTIKIDEPPGEVFEFTLNPKNTPKWVDSIVYEEANEWPVKLGSVYRNQNKEGKWSEYVLTEFKKDKLFTLTSKDGNYNVRYKLTQLEKNSCELEYYEWVDNGELEKLFTIEILQKLKNVIEAV